MLTSVTTVEFRVTVRDAMRDESALPGRNKDSFKKYTGKEAKFVEYE